jgi:hypothetical protein
VFSLNTFEKELSETELKEALSNQNHKIENEEYMQIIIKKIQKTHGASL